MTVKRSAFGACMLAAAMLAMPLASCTIPPIAPSATPVPATFDRNDVVRGAQLAALGSCDSCHTAQDGAAYAGGRRIETPFGAIYGTNLTPDRDTASVAGPSRPSCAQCATASIAKGIASTRCSPTTTSRSSTTTTCTRCTRS